jgi:signal transduction histidine kinase
MTPRAASRLAWSLLAGTAVLAAIAIALSAANGWAAAPGQFGPSGVLAAFGVVFGTVGALIASRRPNNPIGWMFVASGFGMAFQEVAAQWAIRGAHLRAELLPLAEIGAWIPNWIWPPITLGMASFLFLLFPTGHPPTPRWRVAGWVTAVGIGVATFALAFTPGPLESFETVRNPVGLPVDREVLMSASGLGLGLGLMGTVLSLVSLVVRLRRSGGDERAQMRWLITAAVLLVVTFTVGIVGQFESNTISSAAAGAIIAAFLFIPIATGIAILKYRLYDIDVVVNRAVVYAALAVFITIDYVAIVVGVGALVGRQDNPVLTAVAAAVAAITFQPLRRRLQHFANRLVYGKRATPYEVLSDFSERVGEAYAVEDVLPRMARALGEGTGAVRSEVQLRVGAGLRPAAAWPADAALVGSEPDLLIPVTHGGADLGALAVWKARGEAVTPVEEKLVADLAAQAGLVLRNVRLVEEIRESRRRLVTAQDTERRRLERDIHDGAQQHLVSLMVKIRVLESLARKDPGKVSEGLGDLKAHAGEALDTLRDLARGIYPPLLADQGLAAAIESQARKSSVAVDLHPDGVGRYPQEVEAAVYFCVLEALQNVAKYSGAERADLTLRQIDGRLEFEVRDAGQGFDPATTQPGSGLVNMRDRLEALGGSLEIRSAPGGGTEVTGRVPVGVRR